MFRYRPGLVRILLVVAPLVLAWTRGVTAQTIIEYPIRSNSFSEGITTGPDGALWFTESNYIGRITTAGAVTEYAQPNAAAITAGSDGALWFTAFANYIGRITTAGAITSYQLPKATVISGGNITSGPDGALWFTQSGANYIGRLSTAGALTQYAVPTPDPGNGGPGGITSGSDGALWFTETGAGKIGRITTAGAITEYQVPTPGGYPYGITAGPDGALWFTEANSNKIGRITTAGVITEYSGLTANSDGPRGITAGSDGALWFTEYGAGKIGRITTLGAVTEYTIPTVNSIPFGITSGPDGAVWFTEASGNNIGTVLADRLTITETGAGTGQVTSSPTGINCSPSSNQCTAGFIVGTTVNLTASAAPGSVFVGWSGGGCGGSGTCQLTLNAATTVTANFALLPSYTLSVAPSGSGSGTVTSNPSGINCGMTCNASFYSGEQVTLTAVAATGSTFAGWSGGGCSGILPCTLAISANTAVSASFVQDVMTNIALYAAVLPLSRSVEVGGIPATAFATILNAGTATASTCTIAPATVVPASFAFQTTDPTTNALTGTANTPADIPAGGGQSFVIAFTPNAAFAPTNVAFTFGCANASPAALVSGIDTLVLSASTSPTPDIVALAASGDPGYVDIAGAMGTGAFAVATTNLGAGGQITVSADTGAANVPAILTLCQTNPSSGACLATPTPNVITNIAGNATPTFGIFVAGSATVPDLPAINRVFVRFTDSGGALRGETSVAVRTR
jgi:virginiamycin B lyase